MNNWSSELQGIIVTFCFNQFPSGVGESALKGKRQWQRKGEIERVVGDGNVHGVFSGCTDIYWKKRPDSSKYKMTFLSIYITLCRFSVSLLLSYTEFTLFIHSRRPHMLLIFSPHCLFWLLCFLLSKSKPDINMWGCHLLKRMSVFLKKAWILFSSEHR